MLFLCPGKDGKNKRCLLPPMRNCIDKCEDAFKLTAALSESLGLFPWNEMKLEIEITDAENLVEGVNGWRPPSRFVFHDCGRRGSDPSGKFALGEAGPSPGRFNDGGGVHADILSGVIEFDNTWN